MTDGWPETFSLFDFDWLDDIEIPNVTRYALCLVGATAAGFLATSAIARHVIERHRWRLTQ